MTDTYRIVAAVKATLVKPNDEVTRPMSLKTVFFIWLFLLVASFLGAWYFDFGG